MGITSLLPALHSMRRAYDGLLVGRRSVLDSITPGEETLKLRWRSALVPALTDLYWWPLRNGIDSAPDDEDKRRKWLLAWFSSPLATYGLALLFADYMRRGFNLGGSNAFEVMGIQRHFALTNPELVARLQARIDLLLRAGTPLSLIDTTVEHLVRDITTARLAEGATVLELNDSINGRAAIRSGMISDTELSFSFAAGLAATFARNGVSDLVFLAREDACVEFCLPLHGDTFPADNIPPDHEIPIHTGCRCAYGPAGEIQHPDEIWNGN